MTNNELFTAATFRQQLFPCDEDPLAEALRIDDQRSHYCEQLERRIAEQSEEIETLRAILGKQLIEGIKPRRAQEVMP